MGARQVRLHRLGLVDYDEAMAWLAKRTRSLAAGGEEALALLEHTPVYTSGVSSRPAELLASPAELEERGAAVLTSDRGGRYTFHGPGQLVVYSVLDLRSRDLPPADYVRLLEETIVAAVARLGVAGERVPGRPGVWVGEAKIASVGVRVRGGVTSHGVALNVSTDLAWFDAIVPCGLDGVRMTSVERVLGAAPAPHVVDAAVCEAFEAAFRSRLVAAEDRNGMRSLAAAW